MQRLKPTPFFLVSIGLILYGLYSLIFLEDKTGWGGVAVFVMIVAGVIGLMLYAVFRTSFKTRIWTEVVIESILIAGLLYYGYRTSGFYEFRLPHNYKGYVIVVFGVEKASKLRYHFYSNRVKVDIPLSGIIATSSLPNDYYSNPSIFLDSSLGRIDWIADPFKRYDIPYGNETLKCGNKNYPMNIWFIHDTPSHNSKEDSINHLDEKLAEACMLTK